MRELHPRSMQRAANSPRDEQSLYPPSLERWQLQLPVFSDRNRRCLRPDGRRHRFAPCVPNAARSNARRRCLAARLRPAAPVASHGVGWINRAIDIMSPQIGEVNIRFRIFRIRAILGFPLFEMQSNLVRAEDAGLRPVDAGLRRARDTV